MMCGVRSKKQGGTGYSSIIVISPLQCIIRDQMVEVNSMGMTTCDLNEKQDAGTIYTKGNSILFTRHLKPPWISVLTIH